MTAGTVLGPTYLAKADLPEFESARGGYVRVTWGGDYEVALDGEIYGPYSSRELAESKLDSMECGHNVVTNGGHKKEGLLRDL